MKRGFTLIELFAVLAAAPLTAALLVAVFAGCEKPPLPYVPKRLQAPPVVYCNDNTGHKPGNKPWIMGGKCCCTPSEALMAQLQRDGFCQGMTADELRQRYESKGIALRGPGHQFCNGLCKNGPHVVLGGKCMCPPTPGTKYYEQVVTGRRPTPAPAK